MLCCNCAPYYFTKTHHVFFTGVELYDITHTHTHIVPSLPGNGAMMRLPSTSGANAKGIWVNSILDLPKNSITETNQFQTKPCAYFIGHAVTPNFTKLLLALNLLLSMICVYISYIFVPSYLNQQVKLWL